MSIRFFDWLEHHAQLRPDRPAITDLGSGRRLSYAALDRRAAALAAWLQAQGVGRGDRVALLLPNCAAFFEMEFACARIGAICLPLNWRLAEPELAYILADADPAALIYDSAFAATAQSLIAARGIGISLETDHSGAPSPYEQAAETGARPEAVECTLDDVWLILYTSGTTGRPKGVTITYQMVMFNILNMGVPNRVTDEAVQLVVLPIFHVGGINLFSNPILHAGGHILLTGDFQPDRVLELFSDPALGITHFFGVPAHFQMLMQAPGFAKADLSRLICAGVGGAPCAEVILKTWQDRGVALFQGWGMTETAPGAICLPASEALRKLGSSGKPVMHNEIRVVDSQFRDVTSGDVGELLVRGPNVTPGYWNNPEATAETILDGGWLRTGDAARCDEEGFYYIVDRIKDMYISGGENVYPAEVETVLMSLPGVADVAVIGVPDPRWGETGKAVVVPAPGAALEEAELIAHCLRHLAKYKVPKSVAFVEDMPRNASGKVLKADLRAAHAGPPA